MYVNLEESQVKDLNEKTHLEIQKALSEKNMEYQDVKVVLSVELKDENQPSKTLMQYTRKAKSEKKEVMNMFKELFADLSSIDKNLDEEKAKELYLSKIQNKQDKVEDEKNSLEEEMIQLFKDMIVDPDNKMVVLVDSQYLKLSNDVKVENYDSLPASVKNLVENGFLKY